MEFKKDLVQCYYLELLLTHVTHQILQLSKILLKFSIFASFIAYCKLEILKIKTKLNHFAIKYKLILKSNLIAMQELKNMGRENYSA